MSELPPGWALCSIDDLVVERRAGFWGASGPTPDRPQQVRVVRNGDISEGPLSSWATRFFSESEATRAAIHEGDVLITTSGHVGKTAAGVNGFFASNFVRILRPHPLAVDGRYLRYFLRTRRARDAMAAWSGGSTIQNLRSRFFEEMIVQLAPLNEQRRIVAAIEEHLSHLDAADASLGKALLRVDAFARRVIASALDGSWDSVPLRNVTASQVYGTSAKASSDSSGVPVLRMGNINGGRLDFFDLKYLPADHPDVAKLTLQPGDLLFNRTNSAELVGKSAVFTADRHMTFASYLIRVRLNESCDPHWAALVINGPVGREYIASVRTQQVGQANVNGSKLAAMPIPLPPLEEQRRIVAEVEARLEALDALRASIERAQQRSRALRAAVLAKAFRGELVPQDPADEPAEALLARIRAEREARVKDRLKRHRSAK